MLGIDKGSYALKLAAFEQGRLTHLSLRTRPEWPDKSEGAAVRLLSEMISEVGGEGDLAWMSVKGTSAIAQVTEFPDMADDELASAVRLEVEDLLSQDASEMDCDFDVLETLPDGRLRVLLVAAPRALGDGAIDLLGGVGLYCAGVALDSVALASVFLETRAGREPPASILVNVGATTTNIVLQTGGALRLLRDVEGGGDDITQELAREAGMPFKEAEQLKKQGDEGAGGHQDVLRDAVRPVVHHISRTVAYQTRRGEDMSEFEIYLSGGGSLTQGLHGRVVEEFEVPVHYFDPFENVEVDCLVPEDLKERCVYAVAIGNAFMGAVT